MYASLCKTLCEHAPNFDPPPANTFRRLLLAKCQDEFDNRKRALQDAPANSEQRTIAKHKMLGNMRLIGELGKLGLLHEKILHECLQTLLRGKRQEDVDLECLCHMVRTVGARLDTAKGRPLVDQYFERMVKLYSQEGLSSRIKFMLQDVCELRRDGWMPRRRAIGNLQQPTTLAHIRNQVMPPPPPHVRHSQPLQGHSGAGHDHPLHGRGPHGPHRHRDNAMNPLGNPHDDIFNTPVAPLKKSIVSSTGPATNDYFDLFDTSKPTSMMGSTGRDNRDRDNRSSHGRFGGGHSGIHNGHHNHRDGGPGHRDGPFNNHNGPRNNNQGGNVGLHIPARLLKKPLPQQVEEMSLRPHAAPSLLKPKVMPPPGAQLLGGNALSSLSHPLSAHSSPSTLQAVSVKPTVAAAPLPVKTETKPRATKAEFLEKVQRLLDEHKSNPDMACDEFAKLDIPKKFVNEILVAVSQDVMKEEDPVSIDILEQLVTRFAPNGAADTLAPVMLKLPATKRAGQLAAELVARLLHSGTLDLADVAQWTDVTSVSDDSAPWILTVLQLLLAREGEEALAARCRGVSLLPHLPPAARNKDELAALLERHGLACLQLLSVRLERQMAGCLPSVEALKAFLEGLDDTTRQSPEFVLALVTAALRSASSSNNGDQAAELTALRALCPQLRSYCAKQQGMWALYAAQELWATMNCPRGVLLQWFNLFYEEDIVEEAEFMRWKEDVEHTNMFACKGQALFQLNSWLTWLQEAEDEEEDEADE
ncbi:eukaryotic translation initiation factor 4 gamma 2-like [Varroa destructor]|uniref:Eukaryotic translation initiation factor 4 gamma 2 n=2 Tax=Varroa TaxID=62624 RepID=A0A7M7MF78_VARDE|nr:eukaryotic translation initiation factor 4 gamma 2-like [Varroa destructor]